MKKWPIISLFPLLLASCATEEEIKRRETLKRLNLEMSGQQKIVKGLLLATQRIEKSLGTVSGKIEDNQYQENISLESTVNGLSDQIAQIKETQEISSKKISENQKDLQNLAKIINDQKSFIKKILGQINSISNETALSEAANKTSFKNAIKLYQNKKYDDALVQFSEILKAPKLFKLKKGDVPRIYHNMGIIYFNSNNYENSQIYFSKLFTEHPNSGLNSSGLYHLGLSFKKLKNKEMMNQTFKLLQEKFPKSRYTKKAKKLM
ncbi:MAG: hypothetical protein CME61_02625 [Halobacteriovoraceae bacterium]|nr:hypothetical protein [Halobacteriovoraceae bacterium]